MKHTDQIREILDEIDASSATLDDQVFSDNFNSLELPALLGSVVDYLQPSLLPYEAAVYYYLFRQAIIGNGTQYTRASVRGMTHGVIKSSSGQSDGLSYKAIQKALQGLEDKGALSKAGDTNREGTLYKIHLPEEIQLCLDKMKQAENVKPVRVDPKRELDFYNVKENRLRVFERDNYKCNYCGKQLTRFNATLDHLQPVSKGGDNSYENLITSCLHCNSQRGNRPVMDIIREKKSLKTKSPDK